MPGTVRRTRRLTSPHPLRGFGGRKNTKSTSLRASSVAVGGVNEKQTVTITGTPAGGTFTLTFRGQTTTGIAYNAAANVVEDALEALSTIGSGRVRVTGGALPGTPVVVEFYDALGKQDLPQMTASGASLTGGTTPAVAVTTTLAGDNTDAGRLIAHRGLIIMADSGDATKSVPWDGSSATTIEGVLAMDFEFMDNTSRSDTDLPYWGGPGCDFLAKNLIGYVGHEANFKTWAGVHGCVVTEGTI